MQPAAPRRKGEATGVKVNRRRKTASQLSGGTPGSLKDADPAKKTAPFLQVMRDWHRLHPDDAMPQDMLDAYSLGDLDEAYRLIGEEAEKEGGVEPEENEEAMRREGMHKLEERLASGGAAREDVGGAAAWAKAKKDAAEHGHVDGGVGAGYEVFDVQAHDPGIDKGLGDVEGQEPTDVLATPLRQLAARALPEGEDASERHRLYDHLAERVCPSSSKQQQNPFLFLLRFEPLFREGDWVPPGLESMLRAWRVGAQPRTLKDWAQTLERQASVSVPYPDMHHSELHVTLVYMVRRGLFLHCILERGAGGGNAGATWRLRGHYYTWSLERGCGLLTEAEEKKKKTSVS